MDFSNRLFSKEGAPPDLLPSRLRLPSGETRYVNEIELEEIHLCGYIGPFDLPELKACQQLEWCCETSAFKVINKTNEESNEYLDHIDALYAINVLLSEEQKILEDISLFTEDYVMYIVTYFSLLKQLKESNHVLKITDIKTAAEEAKFVLLTTPETNKKFVYQYVVYKTKTEFNEAFEEWKNSNKKSHKFTYEHFGIICDIKPAFYKHFRPEPSWVLGSGSHEGTIDECTLDFRPRF